MKYELHPFDLEHFCLFLRCETDFQELFKLLESHCFFVFFILTVSRLLCKLNLKSNPLSLTFIEMHS